MDAANGAPPASNIVLVGMMFSGKSSTGRELANRLGAVFVDSDEEVESTGGVDISELWEREGEPGFRLRESLVIAAARSQGTRGRKPVILATGGGVLTSDGAAAALRQVGCLVYLRARPRTLAVRARDDIAKPKQGPVNSATRSQTRPLVEAAIHEGPGALEARFEELLSARSEEYESAADLIVDVDDFNPSEVAEAILAGIDGECSA